VVEIKKTKFVLLAALLGTISGITPLLAADGVISGYYGPCDKNAVAQDPVTRQRLDFNHNWIMNYSDL